jgi:hypothetical protein
MVAERQWKERIDETAGVGKIGEHSAGYLVETLEVRWRRTWIGPGGAEGEVERGSQERRVSLTSFDGPGRHIPVGEFPLILEDGSTLRCELQSSPLRRFPAPLNVYSWEKP